MIEVPFWAAGLGLAAIVILNLLVTKRLMAVSGRYSSLVNRLRSRREDSDEPMSEDELVAALRAATIEEFGEDAVEDVVDEPPNLLPRRSLAHHMLFFFAIAVGGALAAALRGDLGVTATLRGDAFTRFFGEGVGAYAVLFVGGILVGFGTRMAGGCTSGHGLCGVSRAQRGSLVATAAFFGAGIIISLALGRLL